MKKLDVLVTGDWHIDSKEYNLIKAELSLKEMLEYCTNNDVDVLLITGDVWERAQIDPFYDSNLGAGVKLAKNYLEALSELVSWVVIVKGNNSHDPVGSIQKLDGLRDNIIAYERPIILAFNSEGYEEITPTYRAPEVDFIITLIPYPTKQGYVTIDSIDNNNSDFIDKFEEYMSFIGSMTNYNCPKIMGAHVNVSGSRLTSGQTLVSQDILLAPKTLERAGHHYYGLGHIHLRQFFTPYMGYSGSLYNKNWGETDNKSFEVVHFEKDTNDDWDFESKRVFFKNARPMIKLEADFDPDLGFVTKHESDNVFVEDPQNSEIRYRVTVKENDRKLITDEKIIELKSYFQEKGNDIKVEINLIPDVRESRSETIMDCNNIVEEVKAYAKVVEYEFRESLQKKVINLQTEFTELGGKK